MLYSYRHPDLAAKDSQALQLTEQEVAGLVERRKFVRSISIPAAIESTDDEMWALWDKAADAAPKSELF
jgi:hypothetical protein